MKRTMVRYKVTPDRTAENEAFIAMDLAQLDREKPAGLRDAPFRQDDGVRVAGVADGQALRHVNRSRRSVPMITTNRFVLLAALGLALGGCAPEIGSDKWCAKLKEKPKGDWSLNEATDFARHCVLK